MASIEMPSAFYDLFKPSRYKVFYGGRGGAKSWNFARALIARGYQKKLLILCLREYQNSIRDSVKKLIEEQIEEMGLINDFIFTDQYIECKLNGTRFLFKGMARNIQGIKGTEGVDIAWVEEGQTSSQPSLDILIPTIRKKGSEIWVSYNPYLEGDPMHQMMLSLAEDEDAIVKKVGWRDNPWFTKEMNDDRKRALKKDKDGYDNVWEGECLKISEAVIFRHRVAVEEFTTPPDIRFYYGADWGFAQDPTHIVRCYIVPEGDEEVLYIDHEARGVGVELDETPALFDRIPEVRKWPIKADNARPETISFIKRRGFNIKAADKWSGSVEDGIARLKAFKRIVVHPRCHHIAKEFRMYSYKVDKLTADILPDIVDAWNHGIDALRYALDGIITNRRGFKVSKENLAKVRTRRLR